MKNRIIGFCISILVILTTVLIPIFIDNDFLKNSYLIIYLIIKCLYLLALIGFSFYFFIKDSANSIMCSVLGITAAFQLLPLSIRGLAVHQCQIIYSILVLMVGLILYLAIIGGLMIMNGKMNKSDEKNIGKEIPIESETTTLE